MNRISILFLSLILLQFAFAEDKIIPITKNASDIQVEKRISRILLATQWYPKLELDVREGLVFLSGSLESKEQKEWAIKLIERMEGVVAIVDKTELDLGSSFAISPVQQEVNSLVKKITLQLPYIVSAIFVLGLFLIFGYLTQKIILKIMTKKNSNALLTQAIASISAILVFLIGLYLALRTGGLSGLAFTVLGGTGFIGIGIALALKGTIENYASGLVISLRKLFKQGEIVNIAGHEGVVQSVSIRGTTLMDYEGNHIIIPNSMIFESVIKNLTRNPNMRTDFIVGIGYSESIDEAQKVILDTIKSIPNIILSDPQPIITTDSLAAATANLRIYFWFNSVENSKIKVKSLLMQKVKENLMRANISMPDDAREVIFASPLRVINGEEKEENNPALVQQEDKLKKNSISIDNEPTIDLKNEIEELKFQANKTEPAELGKNILEGQ